MVDFAAGEITKTITVNLAGDSLLEGSEAFLVTLSNASLGTSIGTASASGIIVNDDTSLSIAATSANKAEDGYGAGEATPFAIVSSPTSLIDQHSFLLV